MVLEKFLKNKKNIAIIIGFLAVVFLCIWAFVSAGMITKSFKTKIIEQTYKNKEANIESLLVTETKDGEKLFELYAEKGRYTDTDNIVLLLDLLGNFYDGNKVKASFKADQGTYNTTTKQIILKENVLIVYEDGINISTDMLIYSGKNKDILAKGNVRIEKPNEAVIMGSDAVLEGDHSDFHIKGRTKTQFYM
ncbi:MAG: LPS export ABC transporter periplasmic protein LptC [Candidatus Gastranaerophilales bacterium]|nr:LPS export ABC transporter periplasmic protein LptC [Candidatus Gastranaerophilales bacterium]